MFHRRDIVVLTALGYEGKIATVGDEQVRTKAGLRQWELWIRTKGYPIMFNETEFRNATQAEIVAANLKVARPNPPKKATTKKAIW